MTVKYMKQPIFSLGENKLTTDYELILDLGNQPWGNNFLNEDEVGKESIYPLQLVYCNESELLQLSFFVSKEIMFKNHTYISGTTKTLLSHFFNLAEENTKQYNLDPKKDIILDIGGNDGSQLIQYKKLGFENVINFESADNISKLSIKNNISTVNDFFNESNVKKHLQKDSIKLINASGVFFHLEELDSVIKGINYCLSEDGVFIVQFMYVGSMIDNLNFDTIYHEHLCYYTLNSLTKLLNKYNLHLEDAYFTEIHSGSIIAKFRKRKYTLTSRTLELIERDNKYTLESIKSFASEVELKRYQLKSVLENLVSQNKKIYAYGAPVKGNTLLNYMGIDNSLISKVVEVNPYKIGTYTPGSHIPVISEDINDLPDYYLLLSHNFEKEILNKNAELIEKGVKFIIPFPKIKIIEK
jgi:hypothetical protein